MLHYALKAGQDKTIKLRKKDARLWFAEKYEVPLRGGLTTILMTEAEVRIGQEWCHIQHCTCTNPKQHFNCEEDFQEWLWEMGLA